MVAPRRELRHPGEARDGGGGRHAGARRPVALVASHRRCSGGDAGLAEAVSAPAPDGAIHEEGADVEGSERDLAYWR